MDDQERIAERLAKIDNIESGIEKITKRLKKLST